MSASAELRSQQFHWTKFSCETTHMVPWPELCSLISPRNAKGEKAARGFGCNVCLPAEHTLTRVVVTNHDIDGETWNTIGLASNIVDASFDADMVRRVNRMKGRPAGQVGSVVSCKSSMDLLFDWEHLPPRLPLTALHNLIDVLYIAGPIGFRGPAASGLLEYLTNRPESGFGRHHPTQGRCVRRAYT